MFAKKIINQISCVLWGFILLLSLVQPVYAAPVKDTQSTAAPAMLQFTSGGHVLGFSNSGMVAATGDHALRVDFVDANGVQPQSDEIAKQESQTAPLKQVAYKNLWKGIDLDYSAKAGSVYSATYHIAPGANPADIRLHYNAPVTLNSDGTLGVTYKSGTLSGEPPVAYQEIQGDHIVVTTSYQLNGQEVEFKPGTYNPGYELTIAPGLAWNTFLGESGSDDAWGVAMDGSGNVFVTGTSSASWGSPVLAYAGKYNNAYVAKLDTNGTLLWNTFLGGNVSAVGQAITVDGSGNVLVTGSSCSSWGAPLRAFTGGCDVFVSKLNPTNGVLVWNTFLGGSNEDMGRSIVADRSGNVIISGNSSNTWGSPLRAYSSGYDGFAAKLNSSGVLQWNTFIGGSGDDNEYGGGVAVDSSGNIYLAGFSTANWGSPIRAYSGGKDGFAAKLSPSGSLVWNTFLGSSEDDWGDGITVDGSGNVYMIGSSSATWGDPMQPFTNSAQIYVVKFNSTGTIVWSTFTGGVFGNSIAADSSGNIITAGNSYANWGAPLQPYTGGMDTIVTELNSSGALQANTFLGGSGDEQGNHVAVDGSGNIVTVGFSTSAWGAPIRAYSGGWDGFVAKVNFSSPPPGASTLVSPLATVTTGKPTFIWSKVTASTYYRLWIKNSGGTWVMQNLYYGQNICGATNCAIVSPITLANGNYTWCIQTLTATQNGAWSAHTFTVAIPTLGVSTLVSPKGTTHLAKPTFIWSKDSASTLYRLWVKNSSGAWIFQNLYAGKNICGATNCAIVSPVTLANGSYTWYIQTLTNTQNGLWSAQVFVVSVADEVTSPMGDDVAAIK